MHCETISTPDIWVDIIIPLLCAIIGGLIAVWGVFLTFKHERKNAKEQAIQDAKPWLFSMSPMEDYDHKKVTRIYLSNYDRLNGGLPLEFIIKNTDNGIGIIERFQTEKKIYFPKVGKILDKNSVNYLYIDLEDGETLNDMYLYVKDIYGNCYKYEAYQGHRKDGNHIKECAFILAAKWKKMNQPKKKKREKKL